MWDVGDVNYVYNIIDNYNAKRKKNIIAFDDIIACINTTKRISSHNQRTIY